MARISEFGPDITYKIQPIDREHQMRCKQSSWWEPTNLRSRAAFHALYGTCPEDIYQDFLNLNAKLLSFGGHMVIFPAIEEDAKAILNRGYLRNGRSKMMMGRPSQCHSNTAELWERNVGTYDVSICTGYALSQDGLWRQHSWLLHRYTTSRQARERVIETTAKRLAYFGFEMTQQEAALFASQQV